MRPLVFIASALLAVRAMGAALPLVPQVRSFAWSERELPSEGYRLEVTGGVVRVAAADAAGRDYAFTTLRQLGITPPELPRAELKCEFPSGESALALRIEDYPAYRWRGMHLDVSRHFYPVETVMRFLDLMAAHKFNVFHWHLTDGEGWRLPSARYPRLNTVGATRTATAGRTGDFRDLESGDYGPFGYTRAEIAAVLRHAERLNIRVVPEIELPGHSAEVVRAYPELSCGGSPRSERLVNFWNPSGTVQSLCPGKDATVRFYEDVFDELLELFPGAYVHLGGDECNRTEWEHCPACRERMRAEELKDTAALQGWLVHRVAAHVAAKGRRVIGWDEVLDCGVPTNAVIMSWRGVEGGIAAAESGRDVVMCPEEACYFDFSQRLEGDVNAYPQGWGATLPLDRVYAFDPAAGVPERHRRHVLGAQGNNWAELTCSEAELFWKCSLRMAALSEVLWTAPARRSFAEFAERLEVHRERLLRAGVPCAVIPRLKPAEAELARVAAALAAADAGCFGGVVERSDRVALAAGAPTNGWYQVYRLSTAFRDKRDWGDKLLPAMELADLLRTADRLLAVDERVVMAAALLEMSEHATSMRASDYRADAVDALLELADDAAARANPIFAAALKRWRGMWERGRR